MARQPHEFAVIGLGRFGSSVALTLMEGGYHVLGIDRDRTLAQAYADRLTRTVALNATDEQALHAVDIASFDIVVVAIGTDFESTMLTTVALKNQGVKHVITKAVSEQQRIILLKIGADQVVLPEHEAGQRLARSISTAGMLDVLDLGKDHSIIEMRVPQPFIGRSLKSIDMRQVFGVTALAVRRNGETIVPETNTFILEAGDSIILIGRSQSLRRLNELLLS